MRHSRPDSDHGFTLIELLVAMAIIAVGILATMAMQYSALAGYSGARDGTGATEMAKTVEQAIQAEARGWEYGEENPPPGTDTEAPYDDRPAYFNEAFDNDGDWVLANIDDEPMTMRHNVGVDPTDNETGDDGTNRYCVYVAGDELETGYARIAVAVVYPAPNSSYAEWGFDCPGDNVIDDELNTSNRNDLELEGLRSTHLSTAVQAAPSNSR